jgi:hypothetical protein
MPPNTLRRAVAVPAARGARSWTLKTCATRMPTDSALSAACCANRRVDIGPASVAARRDAAGGSLRHQQHPARAVPPSKQAAVRLLQPAARVEETQHKYELRVCAPRGGAARSGACWWSVVVHRGVRALSLEAVNARTVETLHSPDTRLLRPGSTRAQASASGCPLEPSLPASGPAMPAARVAAGRHWVACCCDKRASEEGVDSKRRVG